MEQKDKLNGLLCLLLLCYSIPIFFVWKTYNENNTLSNVLNKTDICNIVSVFMLSMCIVTLLYEHIKNDKINVYLIISLLLFIQGIIHIDENKIWHEIVTVFALFIVVIYMIYNTFKYKYNMLWLYIILGVFLIWRIITGHLNGKEIFKEEVSFLVIFALFFIHSHYLFVKSIK
jgi:hypothetical protein